MAGTAPTDSRSIRMLNAGPVHCSVWFFGDRYRRMRRDHVEPSRETITPTGKRDRESGDENDDRQPKRDGQNVRA
jgi:hypothetical protein